MCPENYIRCECDPLSSYDHDVSSDEKVSTCLLFLNGETEKEQHTLKVLRSVWLEWND
jgi:hypothetical protein